MSARVGPVPRLGRDRLQELRGCPVRLPPARRADDGAGIVHLGVGAFHRAHQAVFTEDAMEAEGTGRWGILGVTQRSRSVVNQLAPQDGLYTVLDRDQGHASLRVVGAIRDMVFSGDGPDRVVLAIADPAVAVVTLTITEKGYRRDETGRLDLSDPHVLADLAGAPPVTAVGQLVRGLQARGLSHAAPITVMSCDNLAANGRVVSGLVRDFCAALPGHEGGRLWDWVAGAVRFPSSMVDRIVPATTPQDHAAVENLLGVHDAGLVVTEPFRQWVIEDAFAGPRPAWELAGAIVTSDVEPYEAAKLRLLNGAHSLLAYTGALAGHATIASAVRDEKLAKAAWQLMVEDAAPTLRLPSGFDLDSYQRSVLQRFANPALRHRTVQVAMDGSQKLPIRLLGTIRDRLRAGAEPRWAALGVAAWMVYLAVRRDVHGRRLPVDDPRAERLCEAAQGPDAGLVDRMLAISDVFDAELASSTVLRDLLRDNVTQLRRLVG